MTNSKTADEMANAIRSLSMDAVEKAVRESSKELPKFVPLR